MRGLFTILYIAFLLDFEAQTTAERPLSRNLVPNGSFENYRRKSLDVRKAVPWQQIESVDFYQKALDNDTTPQKGAYAGYCYTGFRFRKNYHEYLQVRLAEPLHRGTIYEFSMHVRLAFWSNAALESFGAVFTKAGYRGQKDAIKSMMVDSICPDGFALTNNYEWITIKGFYKSDGGEKFISIGNFVPLVQKDMTRLRIIGLKPREAYYFVDDIQLRRAPQFEEKIATERIGPDYLATWADTALNVKKDISVGEKVSLNAISFTDGKYNLSAESSSELNKLAAWLLQNPTVEIRINGHSDNTGLEFRNVKMSELRARAVFEYLIRKGVQNKMYFKGFGSSAPIADNALEEGRSRNRRVEFEIVKK